ncbi:MAG: hypothetical protein R2873_05975 [Caldilineaceae bacterium]
MIGPHVIGSINHHQQTIQRWQPRVALLLSRRRCSSTVENWSPNTFVGRVFRPDGEIESRIAANPQEAAHWAADIVRNNAIYNREIDAWQFNNEVMLANPTQLGQTGRVQHRLCRSSVSGWIACRYRRFFCCGCPEVPELDEMAAWKRFLPAMRYVG